MTSSQNDDTFEQLKQSYVEDLYEDLDLIDNMLMKLSHAESQKESFLEVKRMIHNHKANASSFDFHVIAKFLNQFEDSVNSSETLDYVEIERNCTATIAAVREALRIYLEVDVLDQFDLLEQLTDEFELTQDLGKILLVETSKIIIQLHRQALTKIGVGLSVCHDGYQALGRVLHENYLAVVASQQVPQLTGLSLFAAMAVDSRFMDMETILMTSDRQEIESFIIQPMHIIDKSPRAAEDLVTIIQGILAKRG
ncbi:MAG: hypothetical protein OXT67_04645 [Zetaproteobacteria bacterium]|nr:hypothetical protein [Zetaproteobacteria bacterium]